MGGQVELENAKGCKGLDYQVKNKITRALWGQPSPCKCKLQNGVLLELSFAGSMVMSVYAALVTIPAGTSLSLPAQLDRLLCGKCGNHCPGKCCMCLGEYLGLALMALITILCVILNFRAWEPFCDLPSETPHGGGWCYSRDLGEEFAYSYVFTVIIRILVTDPLVLFLKVLAFRIFFRSDDGSCKYKIIGFGYGRDYMV